MASRDFKVVLAYRDPDEEGHVGDFWFCKIHADEDAAPSAIIVGARKAAIAAKVLVAPAIGFVEGMSAFAPLDAGFVWNSASLFDIRGRPVTPPLVLTVGRVYRAKRPKGCGLLPTLYDDRTIKWINSLGTQVQYDSPSVRLGRHFPVVSAEKFLKWAEKDVTDVLPKGEWEEMK